MFKKKKKSRSTDEGGTDGVRDGEREKLSAEGKRERERAMEQEQQRPWPPALLWLGPALFSVCFYAIFKEQSDCGL